MPINRAAELLRWKGLFASGWRSLDHQKASAKASARGANAMCHLTWWREAGQSRAMTENAETAGNPNQGSDIASLSFEAAMGELEHIVRRLESGDVSLEESVTLYERGHALRQHCEGRLAAAQARIEQVSLGADGRPTGTQNFGEA
jgi:exodeoxyribonuclease VII small subunit